MEREVRIPKQKRSIEKKNSIIDAAYRVFDEKGYNNTNTLEIAKEAGVSTGSLYAYFKDKKDIFLEVMLKYNHDISVLVTNRFMEIPEDDDLLNVINAIINILIESHNISKNFHEEVMSLSHLDSNVKMYLRRQQEDIMSKILKQLEKQNINVQYNYAKMFLIQSTIDNVCHAFVYNTDTPLNKDAIIDECARVIKYLIES